MIWLAWRQFRAQALVVAGLLVVFAIALAINGTHLVHLYDTTVATCARRNDCASARALFQAQASWHNALNLLMLAVPALLGAFWGGLTVGFVQQCSALVLPPQLQNAAIFVVFLLIVMLRPQGLFGRSAERA